MDELNKRTIADDETIGSSGGGEDYKPAPIKKHLKANLSDVEEVYPLDTFKTKADGTPNPNYNKPKKTYVLKFKLNDESAGPANGQVYTSWVSPSVSERSNLGKFSDALLGDPGAVLKVKKSDLLGLPIQVYLIPSKKNPDRLVIDVAKVIPATEDQERIVPDVVLEDIEEGQDNAAALEAALDVLNGK